MSDLPAKVVVVGTALMPKVLPQEEVQYEVVVALEVDTRTHRVCRVESTIESHLVGEYLEVLLAGYELMEGPELATRRINETIVMTSSAAIGKAFCNACRRYARYVQARSGPTVPVALGSERMKHAGASHRARDREIEELATVNPLLPRPTA